jgi:hypothetical protein
MAIHQSNKNFNGKRLKRLLLSLIEDLVTHLVFMKTNCMYMEAMIIMNPIFWQTSILFHLIQTNGKKLLRKEIYQAKDIHKLLLFLKKKCICLGESMISWLIQIYYTYMSLELIPGLSPKLKEMFLQLTLIVVVFTKIKWL